MSKLLEFFGLHRLVTRPLRIIRANGGFLKSLSMAYRLDTLKEGRLVGKDEFGNQYFENNEYTVPKNRWVVYAKRVWLDYDASQVPGPWHRWLHHITDQTPVEHQPEQHRWLMKHKENRSGFSDEYMPSTTTRPKVIGWQPGASQQQKNQERLKLP